MLRIKEAISYALLSGKSITRMTIADEIWPDSKEKTKMVNVSKLLNGKTKTYPLEWIKIICNLTEVDANFLFNIDPMKKKEDI